MQSQPLSGKDTEAVEADSHMWLESERVKSIQTGYMEYYELYIPMLLIPRGCQV